MRDILFHGKRVDNGEWVEGFYVHLLDGKGRESHRIYTGYAETDCGDFYPDWYEVDPDTVGQYTGLTDKNGKKIFEGDICKDSLGNCFVVEWEKEGRFLGFTIGNERRIVYIGREPRVEVIGNIHDNPELMEGK